MSAADLAYAITEILDAKRGYSARLVSEDRIEVVVRTHATDPDGITFTVQVDPGRTT